MTRFRGYMKSVVCAGSNAQGTPLPNSPWRYLVLSCDITGQYESARAGHGLRSIAAAAAPARGRRTGSAGT